MHDVIVVGARVAGASTALLLARAGYRVLLLERSRTPRDTLSTLYIHQPGVAALHRWGVLDDVVDTGTPALDEVRYRVGDVFLKGCSWPADGIGAAYAPRRYLLDSILIEHAVDAGVEFRDNTSVNDLVLEDGRVTGVRIGSVRGGGTTVEKARLVVGADGMRSTVAAKLDVPLVVEDPTYTCAYYTYWSDLPQQFRLFETRGHWVGTIPTNDGATLVAGYFPQEQFADVRGNALESLLDCVARTAPEVREEMADGRQLERVHGTGDQRNFFRRAAGDGWVLVGDAGHHKDSITARGITDAFRQSQLLADCIGDGLHDPGRLSAALEQFAVRRTNVLMPDYRSTLKTARLDAPPHQIELLRAISTSEELTARYFATMSGVCPVDEFLTPEILDRLAEPIAA
ncbi:NAD(P)/FAD-dependent oxidoreductase [Streptomyces sp. NPDC047315]|uniref:NAD(P)/FAD-dependent oxidoreductase n=1 Tax=Streptomyces sp. NPDC047315 TaxID=3155142 RepID=UPI0033CC1711